MTSVITVPDPARVAEDQGIVTPCRNPRYSPEAWFPEGNSVASRARTNAARNLCAYSCPLQTMCLDWGMATKERWAILGGLTESQRQSLREGRLLRDRQARWLAGQTDHAGNLIQAADATSAA